MLKTIKQLSIGAIVLAAVAIGMAKAHAQTYVSAEGSPLNIPIPEYNSAKLQEIHIQYDNGVNQYCAYIVAGDGDGNPVAVSISCNIVGAKK